MPWIRVTVTCTKNVTKFVTECIFVGYTVRERKGKQTIAFLAVTWLLLLGTQNWVSKELKQIWLFL